MTRAELIVAEARSYIGTRWRHLGRSRSGVDCIGLVLLAARAAGVELADPGRYAREPTGQQLRQAAARVASAVPLDAVQPGDVLVFNAGVFAAHVGIAALHPAYGEPSVIHAFADRLAVVEDLIRPPMVPTGAYRFPGA